MSVDTSAFSSIYPFPSNLLHVRGGRINYVDVGPRDGPVLLMLHGNPTWSFYYRTLISAFSATHRVVVPDHLGCGLSDKPQDFDYSLASRIEHVEALIAHLSLERITLVVHDWGGAIGMGVAVETPERFERFVVFNTAAFVSKRIPFSINICRIPGFGALAIRGMNAFCRAALVRAVHDRSRLTKEVRAGYLAPYPDWQSRVAVLRFVEDIPMSASHPSRATLEAIGAGLEKLKDHPMLIVWGGRDFCFNRSFYDEWTRRFPEAESHYLEDASHYVVEDAPERVVEWMRTFLTERRAA